MLLLLLLLPLLLLAWVDIGRCGAEGIRRPLRRWESAVPEAPVAFDRTAPAIWGLPEKYDFTQSHPNCASAVQDQGDCSSCWAFAGAGVLGDRFCLRHNLSQPTYLSPQDLLDCEWDHVGCEMGSLPSFVWKHMVDVGVASLDCVWYDASSPSQGLCHLKECDDGTALHRTKALNYSQLHAVEDMMLDLFLHGPLDTTFNVYSDFDSYAGGVYRHQAGHGSWEGLHSVAIVGWGVETSSNTPFWIVRNSWSSSWGPFGGYWLHVRGENNAGIESMVFAGDST